MRRLLVLVVVLIGLSSGGVLAAAQDATPAAQGAAPLARTNVRYVLPYVEGGLSPDLNVVGTESGVCDGGSVADPARPDAWSCAGTESPSLDPCFENPMATLDEPGELACMASPFSTDVVLFTPTEPLVRQKETSVEDDGAAAAGDPGIAAGEEAMPRLDQADLAELPWAIELGNGEQCTLAQGATAVAAGMRYNYACSGGGWVLGDIDVSERVWTAVHLPEAGSATDLVEVAVAWF